MFACILYSSYWQHCMMPPQSRHSPDSGANICRQVGQDVFSLVTVGHGSSSHVGQDVLSLVTVGHGSSSQVGQVGGGSVLEH